MKHVHVDQAAIGWLESTAREIRPVFGVELSEEMKGIAKQFKAVVEERDALQAKVDAAVAMAERMGEGVWGYEGNKVAEAIQEKLEGK